MEEIRKGADRLIMTKRRSRRQGQVTKANHKTSRQREAGTPVRERDVLPCRRAVSEDPCEGERRLSALEVDGPSARSARAAPPGGLPVGEAQLG